MYSAPGGGPVRLGSAHGATSWDQFPCSSLGAGGHLVFAQARAPGRANDCPFVDHSCSGHCCRTEDWTSARVHPLCHLSQAWKPAAEGRLVLWQVSGRKEGKDSQAKGRGWTRTLVFSRGLGLFLSVSLSLCTRAAAEHLQKCCCRPSVRVPGDCRVASCGHILPAEHTGVK